MGHLERSRDLWLRAVASFGNSIDGNWENKYSSLILLHSFDLVLVLSIGWKARPPTDGIHSGQSPRTRSRLEHSGEGIRRGTWKISH